LPSTHHPESTALASHEFHLNLAYAVPPELLVFAVYILWKREPCSEVEIKNLERMFILWLRKNKASLLFCSFGQRGNIEDKAQRALAHVFLTTTIPSAQYPLNSVNVGLVAKFLLVLVAFIDN
jgi:hypothetical protein